MSNLMHIPARPSPRSGTAVQGMMVTVERVPVSYVSIQNASQNPLSLDGLRTRHFCHRARKHAFFPSPSMGEGQGEGEAKPSKTSRCS
jgi:hypothetical protein